jgi:hypothetical protein
LQELLMPHIVNVQRTLAQQYEAIRAEGAVAHGMMADEVYRRRFNLTLADVQVMRAAVVGHSGSSSPQVLERHTLSQACRFPNVQIPI